MINVEEARNYAAYMDERAGGGRSVQLKKSLLKIVRQYQGLCGQLLEQDDSSTLDAHVTEVENVFEDSLGAFGRDDEEEVRQ